MSEQAQRFLASIDGMASWSGELQSQGGEMTIATHGGPVHFNWWQRLLRRLCGGQDYAVVVYCVPDNDPMVVWLTGVDMATPISSSDLYAYAVISTTTAGTGKE